MKKILAILPAATLALTGCLSSSDDDSSAAVVLPDDYIITQMGEYTYEDGNIEIITATCTDAANEFVWKRENRLGSLNAGDNIPLKLISIEPEIRLLIISRPSLEKISRADYTTSLLRSKAPSLKV